MSPSLLVLMFLASTWPKPEAEANPHLGRARELYSHLHYEEALSELEQALAWPSASDEQRARTHLFAGICRYQLNDHAAARQAFQRALEMDSQVTLPPLVSPKVAAAFAAEVARMAARKQRDGVVETPVPPDPPKPDPTESAIAAPTPEPVVTAPRTWPLYAAGGLGIASLAVAGYCAIRAGQLSDDADRSRFASDADRLNQRAHDHARVANISYGVAAAAAVFGVVYYIVEF